MTSYQPALETLLDRLLTGELIFCVDNPPRRRAGRPSADRRMSIHAHGFTECVMPLGGRACLEMADGLVALADRRLRVILPGVEHCERYQRKDRAYELLWIVIIPTAVNFFASTYAPSRDLAPSRCLTVASMPAWELWEASRTPALPHELRDRARFVSGLTCATVAALDRLRTGSAHPEPASRAMAEQIRAYLDVHFCEPVTLGELSQMVRRSPNHVNALFGREFGLPVREYLIRRRLEKARRILAETDEPVKAAAYACGFRDPLYFSRLFRRHFGRAPARFRDAEATPPPSG